MKDSCGKPSFTESRGSFPIPIHAAWRFPTISESALTDFILNNPQCNIIPNSIIVAIDSHCLKTKDLGNGIHELILSSQKVTDEQLLENVIHAFEARLNKEELSSIELPESKVDYAGEEEEDVDATVPPDSYMAELTKHLRTYRDDRDTLKPDQINAIEHFVKGASKPGLILDGQHRVFGAKEIQDFDFTFPVVLLPGLPYAEQVFHFYVLNNKAKPLSRTHLRRIISTTLSKREINDLYDRLKNAGVEARSAEWTHRMNNDQGSPFRGLIDMGLHSATGVIPENVAYQLVSKFMLLKTRFPLLVKNVDNWKLNENDGRLELFFALWQAIKEKYPIAWESASRKNSATQSRQLFYKVSLLCLQEFVLRRLNQEMPKRNRKNEASPLADPEELRLEVGYQLAFLDETFFTKQWKATGLDTSAGHELFYESLDRAVSKESKNIGNMTLFKG